MESLFSHISDSTEQGVNIGNYKGNCNKHGTARLVRGFQVLPATPEELMPETRNGKAYRGVRYRLIPVTLGNALFLFAMCGACRMVWNFFLAKNQAQVAAAKEHGTAMPSTDWRTLFTEFTQLRNDPVYAWLQEYSFACVRHTLKQLSRAFKNCFAGRARKPRFKPRDRTRPSFMIPQDVKITDEHIYIPKRGYMRIRRRGGNPYPEGVPKSATIFKERGRWYVTVLYEIAAPVIPDNGVVAGIDRNANSMIAVVYSDDQPGEVINKPTKGIYAIKKKRKQRKLARQKKDGRTELSNRAKKTQRQIAMLSRKEANCRHNRNHQNSRKVANQASVVVVGKLSVRGMTKSGRGTNEKPGKNVQQKAGLNRVLLEGAPGLLVVMLCYKCLEVPCVPARYTSQICSMCGYRDVDNRTSLRKFVCMSCGHAEHADLNAAANILASGTGATGRARGDPLGIPTTRQMTERWTAV